MLYDQRWDQREQTGLDLFIAWLEMQPADKWYDWHDSSTCLFARFAGNNFSAYVEMVGSLESYVYIGRGWRPGMEPRPLARDWKPCWTFGQALVRARQVRQEQNAATLNHNQLLHSVSEDLCAESAVTG